jgi:hypothetical protein
MKGMIAALMVVCAILVLPSAAALNCTRFYGEYNTLCGIVNPLGLPEENKSVLMSPGIYGEIRPLAEPPDLSVQSSEEPITLQSMYDDHLVKASKIVLFIILNYLALTLPSKSSFLIKWLNVGS